MLYSGMIGKWSGSLVEAGAGGERVTPAELMVVPAPDRDGLELRYRHRSGGALGEQSLGHWHFARSLAAAQLGDACDEHQQSFDVVEQAGGLDGSPLQLVLEADGMHLNQPTRIRQVIDIATGTLQIRKEVQVAGGDFMFREAYVFRRAE